MSFRIWAPNGPCPVPSSILEKALNQGCGKETMSPPNLPSQINPVTYYRNHYTVPVSLQLATVEAALGESLVSTQALWKLTNWTQLMPPARCCCSFGSEDSESLQGPIGLHPGQRTATGRQQALRLQGHTWPPPDSRLEVDRRRAQAAGKHRKSSAA